MGVVHRWEITTGLEAARRACELAENTDDVTSIVAGSTLGLALLPRGRANEAMPYLERYQVLLDKPGSETRAFHLLRPVGQVLTWLERYDPAHRVFDEMVERARSESALGALPYALAGKAEVDFRIGNWPAAYAGASEAVRIAEDTDQRTLLAFALISLARVEAAQGKADDCRSHADRAVATTSTGSIVSTAPPSSACSHSGSAAATKPSNTWPSSRFTFVSAGSRSRTSCNGRQT